MNTFRLSNSDFKHLKEVKRINGNKPGAYKTDTIEKQVKAHIEHVKEKMHILRDYLKNEKYFTNKFAIGLSRIRKRTQTGAIPGKYRDHLWIWLVDKNEYLKLKKQKIQSPQLLLPQIQLSINGKGFTTAELWFERKALNIWKDKLSNFCLKVVNLNNKLGYYLFKPGSNKADYADFVTKRNLINFVKFLNSHNDFKGGIGYKYHFHEIIGRNIYSLIKKDIDKIIKEIYDPLIVKNGFKIVNQLSKKKTFAIEDPAIEGYEGKKKKKIKEHLVKERDAKFRNQFRKKYSHIINCTACAINANKKYKLNKPNRFLEMHHIEPLKYKKRAGKITEKDVVLLCPNCHRAIHRLMSENFIKTISVSDFKKSLL